MTDHNLVSTALPINNGLGSYIYYFTDYTDTYELLLDYKSAYQIEKDGKKIYKNNCLISIKGIKLTKICIVERR